MDIALKIRIMIRLLFRIGLMFAVIFQSAGRWDYWNGWIYFLLHICRVLSSRLIIPSELFVERNNPGPGIKKWDYILRVFFGPLTYIIPLVAVLDGGRYRWTGDFPFWVNVLAFIIIFLGYSLTSLSLWKNRFFSTSVRIQKERGHYVVDKGPYAFIRHPGYAGRILSALGISFAMNSLWALIPIGLLTITYIIRTYLEDAALRKELPGYLEYAARVKYRLIPRIW
jgi:protein-S-isoprenylcysteine O-methyltransferase Ste14